MEESVGKNGSVITDYQLEQNNYSDSQFVKDSLELNGTFAENSTLVTDGTYFGEENQTLEERKNVTLVTAAMTGKEVPDVYADYKLNEAGNRVLECLAGHGPKSSSKIAALNVRKLSTYRKRKGNYAQNPVLAS